MDNSKDKPKKSQSSIIEYFGGLKQFLLLVVIVSGFLTFACCFSFFYFSDLGDGNNSNGAEQEQTEKKEINSSEIQPTKLPIPTSTPRPEIHISLSGQGDDATNIIDLNEGAVTFEMTHNGSSNFIVKLINKETGSTIELLVNEIGSYKGTTFAVAPSTGKYLLQFEADGNWTSNIKQSEPIATNTVPHTISGKGDSVMPVFLSEGLLIVKAKHTGSSNFIVKTYHPDGRSGTLVFNEIGQYEGSKSISIRGEKVYYFVISADGDWNITLE